jgi:hypothetical protein
VSLPLSVGDVAIIIILKGDLVALQFHVCVPGSSQYFPECFVVWMMMIRRKKETKKDNSG